MVRRAGCDKKRGQVLIFDSFHKEFCSIAVVVLGKEKLGYNEMEAIAEGMNSVREDAGMRAQVLKRI